MHVTASTMEPRKPNGAGSKCTVIKIFLHPDKIVNTKHPNRDNVDKFSELLVIDRNSMKVNKKAQTFTTFGCDDFPTHILHCL